MRRFNVPNMTCGHCIKTITQAVRSIDPDAQVLAHLATHTIGVTSTADVASLSAAIAAAGYTNALQS